MQPTFSLGIKTQNLGHQRALKCKSVAQNPLVPLTHHQPNKHSRPTGATRNHQHLAFDHIHRNSVSAQDITQQHLHQLASQTVIAAVFYSEWIIQLAVGRL